ncbi:hypothetical protein CC2G_003768 [Coprinopsis cinerea AmutBmut pab1-1]|nr:hypothetical protein CC2G_003768 [Coprinopsis cinerea AmutBmut pab1-1]
MLSRRHKAILVSLPCTVAFFYLLASTFTTSVYLQDTIHRLGPHLTYAGDGIWGIKTCFDSATGSANSARPMVKDGQYPSNGVLETTQPVPGTNGFNVFDNLYLLNGTLYVVTSNPDLFLPRDRILSRPVFPGDPNTDNQPTDKELQFVSPGKAESLFLQRPVVLSGPSMLFYDLDSFINHFYHWWGEVVLGSWRVYSALSPREGPVELLPLPQRFIMPFMSNGNWRDPPGLDAPLMRAAFPNAAIEQADYWQDLIDLQVPVVFQRAVIANRVASSSHPNNAQWFKMISSTMDVEAPENFFEPVRKRIVMNLLGDLPVIDNDGLVLSPTGMASDKPVVTYISRQGGGRRLEANAHGALLVVLEQLEEDGICELQVPRMEELTLSEQVKLAARSTIILGVHGNGLTHQLWMSPSPRSTVIEIFYPEGFLFDYEMLARNMGHKHYAIWNDTSLTYPKGSYHHIEWKVNDDDFQGSSIPVHAPLVADIIRERLTRPVS